MFQVLPPQAILYSKLNFNLFSKTWEAEITSSMPEATKFADNIKSPEQLNIKMQHATVHKKFKMLTSEHILFVLFWKSSNCNVNLRSSEQMSKKEICVFEFAVIEFQVEWAVEEGSPFITIISFL